MRRRIKNTPITNNGIYKSNCKQKADIFNVTFANQCTISYNDSASPNFLLKSEPRYPTWWCPNQIVIIIDSSNSIIAHTDVMEDLSLLKLCAAVVSISLQMIFNGCINLGMFLIVRSNANVQPKHNCQIKGDYRPISLLPIFDKILEKIIYNQVYVFLDANSLLSKNQSEVRPEDPTVYQLIYITWIYEAFEKYNETCAVFLDISKAFKT